MVLDTCAVCCGSTVYSRHLLPTLALISRMMMIHHHSCHDHRYYDQDTILKIVTILSCHDQSPYHRCHTQVASLCDGAVYYGELTQQRLLGEDVDVVEDFQQGRHFPFHVLTFELVFIDVQIRDHA